MRPIGELSRSTDRNTAAFSRFSLVRCRESRKLCQGSPSGSLRKTSRSLPPDVIFLPPPPPQLPGASRHSALNSHRPESVFARYESRLIRTKTILILENCSTAASPRTKSPQNKASERSLCSPSSTAKAGSIATAQRLKHAWLASHHRAPSS